MTWGGEWISEAARHDPEWPDQSISRLRAAIAARAEAIHTGGSPDLALFGRIALGRNRSERWTEALSSALLGDWVAPLYDGIGLGRPALDRLRSEARRIHTQSVPLWQRRPGENRVIPPWRRPSATARRCETCSPTGPFPTTRCSIRSPATTPAWQLSWTH